MHLRGPVSVIAILADRKVTMAGKKGKKDKKKGK